MMIVYALVSWRAEYAARLTYVALSDKWKSKVTVTRDGWRLKFRVGNFRDFLGVAWDAYALISRESGCRDELSQARTITIYQEETQRVMLVEYSLDEDLKGIRYRYKAELPWKGML